MGWMNMARGPAMPDRRRSAGARQAMPVPDRHAVLGSPLLPPYPENTRQALFGMGCFWGVERLFWQLEGVHHGCGLRRRFDTQPDLSGGLHRADGPQRGSARCV